MGKTKYLSVFERGMVVGARRTGLSVSTTALHLGFSRSVCKNNGPSPKGHRDNLTQLWEALVSTWASIPVERFQHLVKSMPRRT